MAPLITMVTTFGMKKFQDPFPTVGGEKIIQADINTKTDTRFQSQGKLRGSATQFFFVGKAKIIPYAIALLKAEHTLGTKNPLESISLSK